MWTQENQRRHKVERSTARRGYPTDVSDQEWALMEPLLPGAARTGRPRKTELRSVISLLAKDHEEIGIIGKLMRRQAFSECQVSGGSVHRMKNPKATEEIEALANRVLAELDLVVTQ